MPGGVGADVRAATGSESSVGQTRPLRARQPQSASTAANTAHCVADTVVCAASSVAGGVARPSPSWTASGTAQYKTPLMARNADTSAAWGLSLWFDSAFSGGRLSLNYQWRGSGYNYQAGSKVELGTVSLLCARLSSSDSDRRSCGSAAVWPNANTAGTGGASNRYLTVGEDPTQSRYWTDYVCEVLVYSRSLTTAEVLAVESYLIGKWGISRQ